MTDKKKILVIDDEADFCLLVKENLEETQEFEVVTCSHPEETEGLLEQLRPDLILLDNVMPKRKGAEIAQALRQDPKFQRIPIIMVSGRGEMVYIKKKDQFRWMPNTPIIKERGEITNEKSPERLSHAYGVDDYVAKPFRTDVLVEVIREVLRKEQKQGPADPDQSGIS